MLEFGACDGFHTKQFLEMASAVDRPLVLHAFEPEPSNFQKCKQALQRYGGRVRLWPLAIGASVGEAPFFVSGGTRYKGGRPVDHYYGSSSLRAPKLVTQAWPAMTFVKRSTVVTTLDAFAAEHCAGPIDFIWADIQGAQGDLVAGGQRTWERVRWLYVEYDNSEMYEGETLGVVSLGKLLPKFDLVEDYGGDALFRNRRE